MDWAEEQSIPEARRGEQDDPDGDGIVNLLEYAYGANPMVSDATVAGPRVVNNGGVGGGLQFVFQRDKTADVLPFVFQSSTDLETFDPFVPDPTAVQIQDQGETELVIVTLSGEESSLFLTLSTSRP